MSELEQRAKQLLERLQKAKLNERGQWCDARAAVDSACDILPQLIAALQASQVAEAGEECAGWIFHFNDDEGSTFVRFCRTREDLERAVINDWWQGDDAVADNGERMAPHIADELARTGVFHAEDGSVYAQPVNTSPSPLASQVAGLEAAAKWVEQRQADFIEENGGGIEPDTNALTFGRGKHAEVKEEYVAELEEIILGIRSLITAAKDAAP